MLSPLSPVCCEVTALSPCCCSWSSQHIALPGSAAKALGAVQGTQVNSSWQGGALPDQPSWPFCRLLRLGKSQRWMRASLTLPWLCRDSALLCCPGLQAGTGLANSAHAWAAFLSFPL